MAEGWLWAYLIVMAGAALWFVQWSRDPKGLPRSTYQVVIAILVWSIIWHAVMLFGGGHTYVDGRPVEWARYTDWVGTAPLLTIALWLTGTHGVHGRRWGLVTTMVVVNVLMILCGMASDLMGGEVARYTIYTAGMLALVALFWMIWGPLRLTAMQQPRPMASLYTTLALILSVLWVLFPVVWVLGPSGLALYGELANTVIFLVLSLVMKVGWSLIDLGRLRQLSDRGELAVH